MAWNTGPDLQVIYKVLMEYEPISKAPSEFPIDVCDTDDSHPWVVKERQKRYKAIDTRTGDISLIQNPLVWEAYQNTNGSWSRVRPTPKIVMTYAEAIKAAKKSTGASIAQDRKNYDDSIF